MKRFTDFCKQFIITTLIIFTVLGTLGYQAQTFIQAQQSADEKLFLPIILKPENRAIEGTPTSSPTTVPQRPQPLPQHSR